ncbi:hypothetical protein DFH09DRAFT_1362518, partial [Mycena vulgaris]
MSPHIIAHPPLTCNMSHRKTRLQSNPKPIGSCPCARPAPLSLSQTRRLSAQTRRAHPARRSPRLRFPVLVLPPAQQALFPQIRPAPLLTYSSSQRGLSPPRAHPPPPARPLLCSSACPCPQQTVLPHPSARRPTGPFPSVPLSSRRVVPHGRSLCPDPPHVPSAPTRTDPLPATRTRRSRISRPPPAPSPSPCKAPPPRPRPRARARRFASHAAIAQDAVGRCIWEGGAGRRTWHRG